VKVLTNSNIAGGALALTGDSTQYSANVALGQQALQYNTGGSQNIAVGASALNENATGQGNVAVGAFTLQTGAINTNNTALGWGALTALGGADNQQPGNNNVGVGANAGANLTSGSNNIYIGRDTLAGNGGVESNKLNIGNTIKGDLQQGNVSVTNTLSAARVVGNQLCLGATCINETQLQSLIQLLNH
jgi:hypothetical protein